MKKLIVIFAIGLLTQQITQAQGTTYVSNVGQPSTGSEQLGSDSWLAAEFFTGNNAAGYMLDSIQLAMTDATGNPSDFTVMIYHSLAGGPFPRNSLVTLNGSLDPSTADIYTYSAPSNIKLLKNIDYFIVLTAGTAVADGAYEWSLAGANSYNRSGGWDQPGLSQQVFFTSSDGSTWNQVAGIFPQYSITATAIPEPCTLGLLGLGGLSFLWHRRKAKTA